MDADANEAVRQQEAAKEHPFDADTDPAPAGVDGNLDVVPQPGGYAGRDPKTEMPRMPSVPETRTIRPRTMRRPTAKSATPTGERERYGSRRSLKRARNRSSRIWVLRRSSAAMPRCSAPSALRQ